MTIPKSEQEAPEYERIWLRPRKVPFRFNHQPFYTNKVDGVALVEYVRADIAHSEQSKAKWDRSGLKEAVQRGLLMGRTKQEFDLQLLLDMLLTIERLEVHSEQSTVKETWDAAIKIAKSKTWWGDKENPEYINGVVEALESARDAALVDQKESEQ